MPIGLNDQTTDGGFVYLNKWNKTLIFNANGQQAFQYLIQWRGACARPMKNKAPRMKPRILQSRIGQGEYMRWRQFRPFS